MTALASIVDVLRLQARERPDCCAYRLLADDLTCRSDLTFASLQRYAQALAGRLAADVRPGDRVLLLFPTSLEFIVAYFACLIVGLVAVPMMPPRRNAARDASTAIIADCAPRLALLAPGLLDGARTDLIATLERGGIRYFAVALEQLDDATVQPSDHTAHRDDLAFLQYTSGSTSNPKGVMVTHANLLANLEMLRVAFGNHPGSTHVSWLPLYHDMGLILKVLQPLYLGASCVLMAPMRFMHRPLDWLRAIHLYRGEVSAAPNFAFDLCVDRFRPALMQDVDLSCWKVACTGAEPIRAATMRRFAETFAPFGFDAKALYPAYGLAEATLFVSAGHRSRGLVARPPPPSQPPTDAAERPWAVGCGQAASGLRIAIVDPDSGRRLDAGEVGEIWIQGASVARGYWNRTSDTTSVFHARIAGEAGGGWCRTGDLGWLDTDGELFVAGRIKDVIIMRGVNHYPQDIEGTVAASHPALRLDHGAAFAVPDDRGGESLVVVQEVARCCNPAATEKQIAAAIRAAVSTDHDIAVRTIVLLEPGALPKTTSGKVQRALTRRRWEEGELPLWRGARLPACARSAAPDHGHLAHPSF